MLHAHTPYPHVGSYALYQDPELPIGERQSELVRILEKGFAVALISYPLRDGAGGNQRVPLADLIDGTPLTGDESREMTDLARELAGRPINSRPRREKKARHEALQSRCIWSGCLQRQMERVQGQRSQERAA